MADDPIKVVLASSAKQAELEHYVGLLGIIDRLAATTSSDEVATSKPAPDIFARALDKLSIDGRDAIAIGDTPVEGALGSGVVTIGLLSGPFAEGDLRDAGAIAIYPNAAALLAGYDRSPLALGA